LGIDLSAAKATNSYGITGSAPCNVSTVMMQVKGHGKKFDAPMVFIKDLPVAALLGQNNFFEKFDVNFRKSQGYFKIKRV
jgi:hypothetical protein